MAQDNTYQRWFVSNAYVVGGRPKMEEALMDYARRAWIHCSVYGFDLPDMQAVLERIQRNLQAQHPQWKPVKIIRTIDDGTGLIWLKIGAQHLTLQIVREELEYIDIDARYLQL